MSCLIKVAFSLIGATLIVACGQSGQGGSAKGPRIETLSHVGSGPESRVGGSWRKIPRTRAAERYHPDLLEGLLVGGDVVIVAGEIFRGRFGGLRFDSDGMNMRLLSRAPATRRTGAYSAVTDGQRVYVWGGCCPGDVPHGLNTGAIYRPAVDAWEEMPRAPLRSGGHTAVWTGEEMIVWGGTKRVILHNGKGRIQARNQGAAYDPRADSWRRIPDAPLTPRTGVSGVWTGDEMIVWGGITPLGINQVERRRDGAAYDPATNSWRPIAPAPISATLSRYGVPTAESLWTGEELLVWNGHQGAVYSPSADSWDRMAPAPLRAREEPSTVWSGDELLVWGGCCNPRTGRGLTDGAAYDPLTDSWRRLPDAPLSGRRAHAAVWSGEGMLVWGGQPFGGVTEPLVDGAFLAEE